MEFHGFKLDFNGLAIFITAITTAYATIKGVQARKKKGQDHGNGAGEGDA